MISFAILIGLPQTFTKQAAPFNALAQFRASWYCKPLATICTGIQAYIPVINVHIFYSGQVYGALFCIYSNICLIGFPVHLLHTTQNRFLAPGDKAMCRHGAQTDSDLLITHRQSVNRRILIPTSANFTDSHGSWWRDFSRLCLQVDRQDVKKMNKAHGSLSSVKYKCRRKHILRLKSPLYNETQRHIVWRFLKPFYFLYISLGLSNINILVAL